MLNFENLYKMQFDGVGKYNIPQITATDIYPKDEFVSFNYAKSCKNPGNKIIHCFIDDYQFARLWNYPDKYLNLLYKFKAICSPDFSTYTDMPMAMQIYNHYRKHWLAAYWQHHGLTVYPTISWSTPESYERCFDGEPVGGIVAISSVGTQKNKIAKELFLQGYKEMIKRLDPKWVIFYGEVPEECDWNVIRVKTNQEMIRERVKNGR